MGNQRIFLSETMTQAQFVDSIRAAMPVGIAVGHDGSRVNFSGAISGSFTSFATRNVGTDLGSTGNISAGAIAINFLAEDTEDTIAFRVATAVNQAGIAGVSATANGRIVSFANATMDTAAVTSAPLRIADVAPGGRVTGIALFDNTDSIFAVSDRGGLYQINANATFGINGGSFSGYVGTATDLLGIQFTG